MKILFSTPRISIINADEVHPYHFAQRLGRDSIAVLPYRYNRSRGGAVEVLVRKQAMPQFPGSPLQLSPITGSLDNPDLNKQDIAIVELWEEAGYKADRSTMISIGSYIVGTQTDEVCYCFAVNLTNSEQYTAPGDGTHYESLASNEWVSFGDAKRNARYSGLICCLSFLELRLG
ncbi:hypothetical protein [Nodosilinea nodulosa]|uniref:hypothetical protein n=1 Tax=Nodosilinea nodulosa TaxID=416001 RepID=UPI0012D73A2B|nr:hypothetical protein [Nodosilinea nodulosa]